MGYVPPNLMHVSIMESKGFGKIVNVQWRSYDEREIKAYDETKIKRSIKKHHMVVEGAHG